MQNQTPVPCPQCNQSVSAKGLKMHLRTHSVKQVEGVSPDSEGVWRCVRPGCTYAKAAGRPAFVKHMKRHRESDSKQTPGLAAAATGPGQAHVPSTPTPAPTTLNAPPLPLAPEVPPQASALEAEHLMLDPQLEAFSMETPVAQPRNSSHDIPLYDISPTSTPGELSCLLHSGTQGSLVFSLRC